MLKKISHHGRSRHLLLLSLLVTLALTGCTGLLGPQVSEIPPTLEPTPTPVPSGRGAGGTLRILYWQAPSTLNPHLGQGVKDHDPSRISYEPLASFDKDGNLVPFLAAEIPSLENEEVAADGKSVIWKLKQGVQWSDGEPFTADDVLFTYEFVTNPEVGSVSAGTYEAVDSVEVIDDYTVKVNFKDVNAAWASPFVGVRGMIIPRHIFEPYNGANAREAPANVEPVGTGPYRPMPPGIEPQEVLFLGNDLIQTVKIVYEPNPFFREADKPFFRRVEVKGGGTVKEAARAVLEAGEVDFAWNLQVDAQLLAELEASGKGKTLVNFGADSERIQLNRTDPNNTSSGERSSLEHPHPFFSDLKVRQAFSYAIDREAIAALYGAAGRVATNNLVSPANFNSPNTSFEYNPEKAAALLDEAGWRDSNGDGVRDKDGVRMRVVYLTTQNSLRQQTQEIVEQNLEAIGVNVDLRFVDASAFFSDNPGDPTNYHQFPADLQSYFDGNLIPNPDDYMAFWLCSQIPQRVNGWNGENIERACSPEYDELYNQAVTELDPEKRQELFIQMNDILINDVVMIPLVHLGQVSGVSPTLEGLDPTPWDANVWNIKDWRRSLP